VILQERDACDPTACQILTTTCCRANKVLGYYELSRLPAKVKDAPMQEWLDMEAKLKTRLSKLVDVEPMQW